MPTVHFDTGQSVQFQNTPTQQDIDEVAQQLKLKPVQSTPDQSITPQAPQPLGIKIASALTQSEQGLAKDTAAGFGTQQYTPQEAAQNGKTIGQIITHAHTLPLGDPRRTALLKMANDMANGSSGQADQNAANVPSTGKVLGDVAGTTLDLLSSGSYGEAAKGSESGKLLVSGGGALENAATKLGIPTSQKIAPAIVDTAGQTLGQTLKGIGVKTLGRTAAGAGLGYGYDVAQNLQSGKTGSSALKPGLGTFVGGSIPVVIGALQAGAAITKSVAPRLINSLIKPLSKDFAYGKNPGQTVSDMGITGNNFNEFADNVQSARKDVGQQLGSMASDLEGKATVDLTPSLQPIDDALTEANKSPRTNSALITRLENVRDDLLGITETPEEVIPASPRNVGSVVGGGADGVLNLRGGPQQAMNDIVQPRTIIPATQEATNQLDGLSIQDGIDFKGKIGDLTKWTGNASDDKLVNKTLKQVYGIANSQIMDSVGAVSPELASQMSDLNDKYGNLLSAESAIKHTDAIAQRQNLISMPVKVGTVTGIIASIATGGAAIPGILAGVGAGLLDKALGSTLVKSKVAAWLADESPNIIQQVLIQNPAIKTVLYRAFPKIASQLGQ